MTCYGQICLCGHWGPHISGKYNARIILQRCLTLALRSSNSSTRWVSVSFFLPGSLYFGSRALTNPWKPWSSTMDRGWRSSAIISARHLVSVAALGESSLNDLKSQHKINKRATLYWNLNLILFQLCMCAYVCMHVAPNSLEKGDTNTCCFIILGDSRIASKMSHIQCCGLFVSVSLGRLCWNNSSGFFHRCHTEHPGCLWNWNICTHDFSSVPTFSLSERASSSVSVPLCLGIRHLPRRKGK